MDMCELAWVTVLSFYGQQRREREGAVACSLPGVAGEGGIFTEDILRGMTVGFFPRETFPLGLRLMNALRCVCRRPCRVMLLRQLLDALIFRESQASL